jgi:uncharacterized protein YecT (DUF1311 family)
MKQYVISLALLIAALVAFPTSHANAQSQAEMNRQAAKDFEKADTEHNKSYEALLRKLPDAEGSEMNPLLGRSPVLKTSAYPRIAVSANSDTEKH